MKFSIDVYLSNNWRHLQFSDYSIACAVFELLQSCGYRAVMDESVTFQAKGCIVATRAVVRAGTKLPKGPHEPTRFVLLDEVRDALIEAEDRSKVLQLRSRQKAAD